MPNSEPGHEQPKITVLFGPFSANEDVFLECIPPFGEDSGDAGTLGGLIGFVGAEDEAQAKKTTRRRRFLSVI